ncbi:MAG: hypothetical protein HOW73_13960 [Polyangiaceae bacterium]|nr:hypothetical protein [Polyangiaceae bacterium]
MSQRRPVGRRNAVLGIGSLFASACARAESRVSDPKSASFWIGGDVYLARGRTPKLAEGLDHLLGGATGIVNLEGPIGDEAPAAGDGEIRLANAPSSLAQLRAANVRVVGIANNHESDLGPGSVERTHRALVSEGFAPCHGVATEIVIGGTRIGITAHDLAPQSGNDRIREDLARAHDVDLLVATFHVTGPPSYLPRPELRSAIDTALRAGARVIVAHGTHALAPVERRDDAVIAWGLGNLVFDCTCTQEVDGGILHVTIEGNRIQAKIIPVDAGLDGKPARPAHNAALIFELLAAIGSSPLEPKGDFASF